MTNKQAFKRGFSKGLGAPMMLFERQLQIVAKPLTRLTALTVTALTTIAFVNRAQAANVEGLWMTPTSGGQVEISRCGDSLCGKLVTSYRIKANPNLVDVKNKDTSLRARTLKDMPVLYDFAGGPTKWTDGKVYNAIDGKVYSSTLTLVSGNQIQLKGCGVTPHCKTEAWNRIK
jgi:uncharacterized protein (DUF2147 family)